MQKSALTGETVQRLALALLLLLVASVYWPGLRGGFVFDDFPNIVANTSVHVTIGSNGLQWLAAIFSSPASELQRPLAMLSFAFNHAITGLDPYWMKLTNLGIHLVNTWLVFGLVRSILQVVETRAPSSNAANRNWGALWVTAVWALTPINLMAVLFVVQRMESLSHTFVFAGLWLYVTGRVRIQATGRGWTTVLGGLVGGTVLGALSKESAVLLPLYALAVEWTLFHFATFRQARDGRVIGLFVLALLLPATIGLAWLLPKTLAVGAYASRDFTLVERLLTEGRVLSSYLSWTILPDLGQLSLYHDDYSVSRGLLSPPSTLFSLLFIAALLGCMILASKRRPLVALGLAWFFAAHALTATVVPLELMYEHRNYFASLGILLALGDILLRTRMPPWGRVGGITAATLLLYYSSITAIRATEWSDPMRFSLSEAARHPRSPRATYDVARNFIILSDYQSNSPYIAMAYDALDRAMRVPGATPLPEAAAITLAARTGRPIQPAWWERLQAKLRLRPVGPQETGALAELVACQLQQPCLLPKLEMLNSFEAALAHGPNAETLSIYGNYALNIQHDPAQALRLWRQAALLAPTTVHYQATFARMLIATGQLDEASAQIVHIRNLGLLGQNASIADELDRATAQARAVQNLPAGGAAPQ